MKDLLLMKDLDLPLSSSTKPTAKSDGDWKREHEKACSYIRHHVDDNVRNHIAGETDALKLWKKLEGLLSHKDGADEIQRGHFRCRSLERCSRDH